MLLQGHPLAFISKLGVGTPYSRAFEDEKEYLDILVAVDQWRAYLQHGEFIIFTYH
jgi:hypothetical protein